MPEPKVPSTTGPLRAAMARMSPAAWKTIRRRVWVAGFLACTACFATQPYNGPIQIPVLLLTAAIWSGLGLGLVLPIRWAIGRLYPRTSWFIAAGVACAGIAFLLVGMGAGHRVVRLPERGDRTSLPAAIIGVGICQFAAAIWPPRLRRPG